MIAAARERRGLFSRDALRSAGTGRVIRSRQEEKSGRAHNQEAGAFRIGRPSQCHRLAGRPRRWDCCDRVCERRQRRVLDGDPGSDHRSSPRWGPQPPGARHRVRVEAAPRWPTSGHRCDARASTTRRRRSIWRIHVRPVNLDGPARRTPVTLREGSMDGRVVHPFDA